MDIPEKELVAIIQQLGKQFSNDPRKWIPGYSKEDLAQEIGLIILSALPKYDQSRGPLIFWLRKVCANRIRNVVRDRYSGHEPRTPKQKELQISRKQVADPKSLMKDFDRSHDSLPEHKLIAHENVQLLLNRLEPEWRERLIVLLDGGELATTYRNRLHAMCQRILAEYKNE